MDDLLHKLVSGALTGGLIALVGYLSMAARRRRAAREEAEQQAAQARGDGAGLR